jgi:uncharacterized membrane protein
VRIDVTARTIIDRPRDEVAAYVIDNRNDLAWIGGITESELLGGNSITEGSRVRRVASFLGRRIEYVMEVARLEPGSVLEMRSVKSPFPMEVAYAFEDAAEGTATSVRVRGEPGAWYRIAGALMSRAVQRSIDADVRRLKEILERRRSSES